MVKADSQTLKAKRLKISSIFFFLLTGFTGGFIAQYLSPGFGSSSSDLPIMIIAVSFIFLWYYFDSSELHYKRSTWLNISIIALPIISLPYYLYRSRGVKGALIGTLILIAVAILYGTFDYSGRFLMYNLFQS